MMFSWFSKTHKNWCSSWALILHVDDHNLYLNVFWTSTINMHVLATRRRSKQLIRGPKCNINSCDTNSMLSNSKVSSINCQSVAVHRYKKHKFSPRFYGDKDFPLVHTWLKLKNNYKKKHLEESGKIMYCKLHWKTQMHHLMACRTPNIQLHKLWWRKYTS